MNESSPIGVDLLPFAIGDPNTDEEIGLPVIGFPVHV
jgi:hypothetical protein